MATKTASASRNNSAGYTEPHKCAGCHKAFWAHRDWNRVTVKCPHCGRLH